MACGARGVFTKFCVEPGSSPHTFDTNSEPYKFDVLTIGRKTKMVIQNDITGTRSFPTEQVRQGPYIAMGDVRMRLSAGIFDLWAPRILGGTLSGGIVDVADASPSFGCLASKAVDREQLKDCVVARGIIRGKAADLEEETIEPIELITQIIGQEHATGTSYPSLTFPTTAHYTPYTFEDAVLTINSVAIGNHYALYGSRADIDCILATLLRWVWIREGMDRIHRR